MNPFLNKVVGLIFIQAIHLKVRLCHPYGSLPIQNTLWFHDVSPFFLQQEFQNVSFSLLWPPAMRFLRIHNGAFMYRLHLCIFFGADSHSVMDKKREINRDKRSSSFKEKSKYNLCIIIFLSTYTKQIFDKRDDKIHCKKVKNLS